MMFTSKVRRNVFLKKEKRAGCNIDDDDDDDDDKDNCFCGMVDRRKALALFPVGTISEILTIVNLRHTTSRI